MYAGLLSVYLGAGLARVRPRCDPVVFHLGEVYEAHDNGEGYEPLQLISTKFLPRPLLYVWARTDGVCSNKQIGIQLCLCDNIFEDLIIYI